VSVWAFESVLVITTMLCAVVRGPPSSLRTSARRVRREEDADGPHRVGRPWPHSSTFENPVGEVLAVVATGPEINDVNRFGGAVETC
jgi:hypothetical protein